MYCLPPFQKKPAQERATSRSKHRRGSQEGRPKRRPERKKRGRPRERRLPAGALPCLCRSRPHWLDPSPEPEPEKTETYIFFLFCIFQEFNFSRLFQWHPAVPDQAVTPDMKLEPPYQCPRLSWLCWSAPFAEKSPLTPCPGRKQLPGVTFWAILRSAGSPPASCCRPIGNPYRRLHFPPPGLSAAGKSLQNFGYTFYCRRRYCHFLPVWPGAKKNLQN